MTQGWDDRSRGSRDLVGRESELALLERLYAEGTPLVTLLGPAGVGKTTLATRFVERPADSDGEDALHFCDLTEASSLKDICAAVTEALSLPSVTGDGDAETVALLGERLATLEPTLLVLDNFEQVATHAHETLGEWLSVAPEMQFLVTSRERLRLPGEVVHELGPLSLPVQGDDARSADAVRLWVARLSELCPGYALSDRDLPTVSRIVRELDGLPLAIELAAARCTLLGPDTLLERLERRFELLANGARGQGQRRATLRGAIDWSWDLLEPYERAALAQCSVFRGGFSLEAAEAIVDLSAFDDAPAIFEAVQSLRDKSLVRAYVPAGFSGELRLGLYLSIRDYAAEKLADDDCARSDLDARHAQHFVQLGERLEAASESPDGLVAMARLSLERQNLRRVIDRAGDDAAAFVTATRALLALDTVAWTRGPLGEHAELLDDLLERPEFEALAPALRARALDARGRLSMRLGELDAGAEDMQAAAAIGEQAKDAEVQARALRVLARIRVLQGERESAFEICERALTLAQASGNASVEGRVHEVRAHARTANGDNEGALRDTERSLELQQKAGNVRLELTALMHLAVLYLELGDHETARAYGERARLRNDEVGDAVHSSFLLLGLGSIEQAENQFEEAADRFRQAQVAARAQGDRRFAALAGAYVGLALFEQGQAAEGRLWLRESLPRMGAAGVTRYRSLFKAYLGGVEASFGRLGEARSGLEAAEEELADDELLLCAAVLCRGMLEVAEAVEAEQAGAKGDAARLRKSARDRLTAAADPGPVSESHPRGAPSPASRSLDVRTAMRVLEGALAGRHVRAAGAGPSVGVLLLEPSGRWFEPPGGERVGCRRRHAMRRMLLALVREREANPGGQLSQDDLLEAGWPGERILPEAARNRLHVTLSRMRALGLRESLLADEAGYYLDPKLTICRAG